MLKEDNNEPDDGEEDVGQDVSTQVAGLEVTDPAKDSCSESEDIVEEQIEESDSEQDASDDYNTGEHDANMSVSLVAFGKRRHRELLTVTVRHVTLSQNLLDLEMKQQLHLQ